MGSIGTILKKIFSIALIFNSLISIACVAGIIYGYYRVYPSWQPYSPFLLNGNLFWLAIAAGIINIFPGAAIGRCLHTGRFLFHHYVYGFFVLASTTALVGVYTGLNVISIFFIDSNAVAVNAGRCFFLAGLALFLDDLPDVNRRVERGLNWIKRGAYQIRKTLHIVQFVTGAFAFYCALSILLSTFQNSARWLPNSFVIVSLFITAITSFALVKQGAWLKITLPETTTSHGRVPVC
jgi:hypothetical protein